jgi:hypothetical protein
MTRAGLGEPLEQAVLADQVFGLPVSAIYNLSGIT